MIYELVELLALSPSVERTKPRGESSAGRKAEWHSASSVSK
jgi:hypothetical protein